MDEASHLRKIHSTDRARMLIHCTTTSASTWFLPSPLYQSYSRIARGFRGFTVHYPINIRFAY